MFSVWLVSSLVFMATDSLGETGVFMFNGESFDRVH